MIFDLDDRLLDLAKKLVVHESPEPETARRFDSGGTRRSLKPQERQAENRAQAAMSTLREDEQGPQGVTRTKQLIDAPGSTGIDEQAWKRAEASQKSTAAPLPPAIVERFAKALGHDVSDISVHTDASADEICRAANSEVVARGRDIFFRRGVPLPGTPKGDALLSNAVEQLSVDNRVADDDQPMRRFVDKEESTKEPEPEPETSGWGLMGLVGAAMAAKQGYDALKGKKDDPATQAPTSEADLAKVAEQTPEPEQQARGQQTDDQQTAEQLANATNQEVAADAGELQQREQRLKEVAEAAEQQQSLKEQLPETDVTKDQVEGLAQMGATAGALLDDVREAKAAKREEGTAESEDEERESVHQVATELGLKAPFEVAGNYEARYRRPDEESGSDDIDIQDHRLLMEVDVDDAATEFEKDAFGPDLGVTVDRVVELVEAHLDDELSEVTGPEREQLSQQIDSVTPQLPEVIEEQVREAAESNTSDEQEELKLELEQEQVTPEAEQAAQDDTFAFGARVDLRTGQVVVTTNDSLPGAIEAAAPTSAPSTTSGGDGGGGGGGGGGGDGGGGGGGGGAV